MCKAWNVYTKDFIRLIQINMFGGEVTDHLSSSHVVVVTEVKHSTLLVTSFFWQKRNNSTIQPQFTFPSIFQEFALYNNFQGYINISLLGRMKYTLHTVHSFNLDTYNLLRITPSASHITN